MFPLAIAVTTQSIVLLQRRPSSLAFFRIEDGSLQRIVSENELEEADLLNPISLVRTDERGGWLLDASTRVVVSFDSTGNAVSHVALRSDTEPLSACAPTDSTILVLSRESFSVIHEFNLLNGELIGTALPWVADSVGGASLGRQSFFSVGSPAASCALSLVFGGGFVSFNSTNIRSLHTYIELFHLPDDLVRTDSTGSTVTTSRSLKNVSMAAVSTATASFGTAVLFAGETRSAGRIVDFYDINGRYSHTIALPFEGRLIAANDSHLYVLSNQRQRWQLSAVALHPNQR